MDLKVDNLKYYLQDCNFKNGNNSFNSGNVILMNSYYDFTRCELKKFNDIEKYFDVVLTTYYFNLYKEKREFTLIISL